MQVVRLCCFFISILTVVLSTSLASGQVTIQNIGFETGTFSGWYGYTGQCCPVYAPNNGLTPTQHLITAGNNTDPYSNGLLSTTAPGSQYSARLGNDNNSAESEILETTFIVPSDSLLLIIKFATVLQNGLHPDNKQSRFSYEIFSQNNVPEGCTSLEVLAGDTLSGTIINGDIEITPWQNRVINLFGMTGDTLTLRFTTGDCGPGGHFGYAYLDCEVIPAELLMNGCNANGSLDLSVNSSLDVQWFNGTTATNITIADPLISSDYYAEFNSNTNCYFRFHFPVEQLLPKSEFNFEYRCNNEVQFNNTSYATPGSSYFWDFGDSTAFTGFAPAHQYYEVGNYLVNLLVVQPNNCRSDYSEIIPENSFLTPEIHLTDSCLYAPVILNCDYNTTGFVATSYNWFVNGVFISNSENPDYIFNEEGLYSIMVTVENTNGCIDTINKLIEFKADPSCIVNDPVYIPNAFTPNGDGKNDEFIIKGLDSNSNLPFDIYNRYGELIFTGFRWDGTEKSKKCLQGLYIIRCIYKINNKQYTETKAISLLR